MTRVELVSAFWFLIFGGILVGVVVATIRMGLDEQAERRRTLDEITRLGQEIEKPGCACAASDFLRTQFPATNMATGEPWSCPVCGDDGTIRWKQDRTEDEQ